MIASIISCGNLDLLIVPGGAGRIKQVYNTCLINFIRQQNDSGTILAAVCTGAFLLAQAGVLNGELVTTYWRAINEFTDTFALQISPQRVVKSGKVWTAGGVTSGIDLALELIHEISGKESMDKVRLLLEYFPSSAADCQLDLANDLPLYAGTLKSSRADLPEYISN